MRILVTGGAGFIGSNLVDALLQDKRVTHVRVLDNLVTGFKSNLEEYQNNEKFEFMEGDIRDINTCLRATDGINRISHQAALGSVPRSIKDPLKTNDVNVGGTLNVFHAAVQNQVDRVVFAASSSTYGDSKGLPKIEHTIGNPLSPYAVTKYVNELYASVFAQTYPFSYIGLRYFNVFGPKQDPNGAYAAVIPLFFKAAIDNQSPTINGNGSFSRDFTFVKNAVHANLQSLFSTNGDALNQIYNVAVGERISLNDLWGMITKITDSKTEAIYGPEREGDIPHSLADISKAKNLLKYMPQFNTQEGLVESLNWYQALFRKKH